MKTLMANNNAMVGGILLLLFTFNGVQAANESPDVLMRNMTDQVMERLLEQEELLKKNPQQVQLVARKLVDEVILPHLDMRLMSRWVIGKGWNKATAAQRKQFINEFTGMLVKTYASALLEFRGSRIVVKPVDRNLTKTNTVVRTEFFNSSGKSTPVLFRVRKDRAGEWKIFDMIVDGVSLVKNYKSSFGAEIRKVGVSGLLKRLSSHNSQKLDA